ncbi:hypothetical protein [Streptococcus dentiloxodontae]
MLNSGSIAGLSERFPTDIQPICDEMIYAYQQSYADYVYQTLVNETQNRPIKNLVKSFRRMNYQAVLPMTMDLIAEIQERYPAAAIQMDLKNSYVLIRNAAIWAYAELSGSVCQLIWLKKTEAKSVRSAMIQTLKDYLKDEVRMTILMIEEGAAGS